MSASSTEIMTNNGGDRNTTLSRAASYNYLPDLSQNEPRRPDLRRTFSDQTSPTQSGPSEKGDVAAGKDILRRSSIRSKERRAIALPRLTVPTNELNGSSAHVPSQDEAVQVPETRPPEPVARPSKTRLMSGRLANFARKPWISAADSRAPSPTGRIGKHRTLPSEDGSSTSSQSSVKSVPTGSAQESESAPSSRRKTVLYNRPRRPVIALVAKDQEDAQASPSSPSFSLQSKTSLENLTASLRISTPILPPRSKTKATANSSLSSGPDLAQKRDKLWNAFRGLEADYQRCVRRIPRKDTNCAVC